jgi:hypothetical protein
MLVMVATLGLIEAFPTTLDSSAWYASVGMLGPAVVLLLTLYGAQTARRRSGNRADPFQEHRAA